MECPNCHTDNVEGARFCTNCGTALTSASVPAIPSVSLADRGSVPMTNHDQQEQTGTPLFLYITSWQLIVLSIASWGLYEAYWIYKNWRYIKERDGLSIRPFWRGFFGIFFCHSLLRRIHEDKEAGSIQKPTFSANGLATGWLVLLLISNILSRAPSIEAGIVAAFIPSFLFLVPVQNYVNTVTKKRNPAQKFYRWSSGHVVCVVFGIIAWGLVFALGE